MCFNLCYFLLSSFDYFSGRNVSQCRKYINGAIAFNRQKKVIFRIFWKQKLLRQPRRIVLSLNTDVGERNQKLRYDDIISIQLDAENNQSEIMNRMNVIYINQYSQCKQQYHSINVMIRVEQNPPNSYTTCMTAYCLKNTIIYGETFTHSINSLSVERYLPWQFPVLTALKLWFFVSVRNWCSSCRRRKRKQRTKLNRCHFPYQKCNNSFKRLTKNALERKVSSFTSCKQWFFLAVRHATMGEKPLQVTVSFFDQAAVQRSGRIN